VVVAVMFVMSVRVVATLLQPALGQDRLRRIEAPYGQQDFQRHVTVAGGREMPLPGGAP
jgi:hypothetical protein